MKKHSQDKLFKKTGWTTGHVSQIRTVLVYDLVCLYSSLVTTCNQYSGRSWVLFPMGKSFN